MYKLTLINKCLVFNIISSRDEFKLKLALLSNQWQGVIRRAQQRRGIIDSLIRQWQRYREMAEKLRKWLVEVSHHTEALQPGAPVPLQQARAMLDAVHVSRVINVATATNTGISLVFHLIIQQGFSVIQCTTLLLHCTFFVVCL